jgi:peptidoglycan/LPS O-acetylase OafA/YrhL
MVTNRTRKLSLTSQPSKGQASREEGAHNDHPAGRLRELDGWRAISVLLVILHHIGSYQHPRLVSRFFVLAHLVRFGGPLGVKTFFVISGFVICRLLISEESSYGSVSLKAFYCRRVFRILPPLYTYLAAVCLLSSLGLIQGDWRGILSAALFLRDFSFWHVNWLVGHTWSLAVEEQFYLIFPAMWLLTPKRWRGRVFLAAYLFCVAWNLSLAHPGHDNVIREGFACISCGVLMAIHEGRARRLQNRVPIFIVALVAVMLLIHPTGIGTWQAVTYECVIVPPAIGLVLFFSMERGRWLQAFLCSKPLQAIGVTSYGIYLWQQMFTAPKVSFSGAGEVIPWLLPLLCIVVPLSYFLIEKPAMRYGKSLSRRVRNSSNHAEIAA